MFSFVGAGEVWWSGEGACAALGWGWRRTSILPPPYPLSLALLAMTNRCYPTPLPPGGASRPHPHPPSPPPLRDARKLAYLIRRWLVWLRFFFGTPGTAMFGSRR